MSFSVDLNEQIRIASVIYIDCAMMNKTQRLNKSVSDVDESRHDDDDDDDDSALKILTISANRRASST